MNRHLCLLALGVFLAAGCGKPTDSARPASSDPGKASAVSTEHLGNRIEIVTSPIRVDKGKTTQIKITATRKDQEAKETKKDSVMYKVTWYQGEIKLEFDTSDATGLKIEPAVIPAGKDSVEVAVTAAADATSGMVGITAKGGPGIDPITILIRADVR